MVTFVVGIILAAAAAAHAGAHEASLAPPSMIARQRLGSFAFCCSHASQRRLNISSQQKQHIMCRSMRSARVSKKESRVLLLLRGTESDKMESVQLLVDEQTVSLLNAKPLLRKDCGHTVLAHSKALGSVYRIFMPGEKGSSFLGALSVPTFASLDGTLVTATYNDVDKSQRSPPVVARALDDLLHQGPAFVLDHVLNPETCRDVIYTCDSILQFQNYQAGKNNHGALQLLVSQDMANQVAQKIIPFIDMEQVELRRQEMNHATNTIDNSQTEKLIPVGLNQRWRVYKYAPGGQESFAPHIDAGFPPSGLSADGTELVWDTNEYNETPAPPLIISRLTVLMYLNEDFVGGETNFFRPLEVSNGATARASPNDKQYLIASVKPKTGSVLIFPQGVGEEAVAYARKYWPTHEGSPVMSGSPKYVIRSDVLFSTVRVEELSYRH